MILGNLINPTKKEMLPHLLFRCLLSWLQRDATLPIIRIAPVLCSRTKNKNGRSITTGCGFADVPDAPRVMFEGVAELPTRAIRAWRSDTLGQASTKSQSLKGSTYATGVQPFRLEVIRAYPGYRWRSTPGYTCSAFQAAGAEWRGEVQQNCMPLSHGSLAA